MSVLEVAESIRTRLGAPTVDALATRFGPEGVCRACNRRFGPGALSLCAYPAGVDHVMLVAYHRGCRPTAWLDDEPGLELAPPPSLRPQRASAWRAAVTCAVLSLPGPPRRWWRRRSGPRSAQTALLVVHPSLETARVRMVAMGEAVNADLETYHRLGFRDADELAEAASLSPVGTARLLTAGLPEMRLSVRVGFETWTLPVGSASAAALIGARRGVLTAIGCGIDPAHLAADPGELDDALVDGRLILGWTPLDG